MNMKKKFNRRLPHLMVMLPFLATLCLSVHPAHAGIRNRTNPNLSFLRKTVITPFNSVKTKTETLPRLTSLQDKCTRQLKVRSSDKNRLGLLSFSYDPSS